MMTASETLQKWGALVTLNKRLQTLARRHVDNERKLLSIAACTGLSFDEVKERTQGLDLDVVLKAAALCGRICNYQEAVDATSKHAVMASFNSAFQMPRVSRRTLRNREVLNRWRKATESDGEIT